ncbi:MAG: YibE/F family protein [Clostridiaceae bacterium]|nr:YibE/F family protein [Clostridiaceae bacterium]
MRITLRTTVCFLVVVCVFMSFSPRIVFGEEENLDYTNEQLEVVDEDLGYVDESLNQDKNVEDEIQYSRAKVTKVLVESNKTNLNEDIESNTQLLEMLIIKGPHKGEKVNAEYELNYNFSNKYTSIPLKVGDEALLFIEENAAGEIETAYVAEIVRDKYLLYLIIGFIALLLLVGRWKGLKAIISLVITIFSVLKILLPAILNGWDPVIISVLICIGVIGISMLIISGFNRKTYSAIIGTVGGVIVAGVIALLIGTLAKLTGLGNEEANMLMFIPHDVYFDFKGLLFAGIIIGTMGATMDVGMSIASAMNEIKENSPQIKKTDLIKAGMNVGKDTMATMANTLILAYVGGSLHLLLLLLAYETSFSHIINWDMIASEILRAIAGSIGIIFTIPITALASGFIEERFSRDKSIQI